VIITPGHLAKRAEFYHQLNQLTSAGIGVTKALEQLERHPPSRSYHRPLRRSLEELGHGKPFAQSLRAADWLPEFDLALIGAGEQSGRLDQCFKLLADYYTQRAAIARQIVSQLLYPAFLVHFAVLIFMIVLPYAKSGFTASFSVLFGKAAMFLLPIYLVIVFLVFANQSRHGEGWRSIMESILHWVPLLGKARRQLAISRLSIALEALISAGVGVLQAWPLAAIASSSPVLRRTVDRWESRLAEGTTPSEMVSNSPVFPETFANLYHSGEISGKLDETLHKLHVYFQDEGSHRMNLFVRFSTFLIYLTCLLTIAYKIIGFYAGYFNQIGNLTNGF
jgi:type II secretory pathway component PulF